MEFCWSAAVGTLTYLVLCITRRECTENYSTVSQDLRQVLEQVEEIPMPPNGMIQNLNLGPLPAVPNFSMALPTSPAPVPFMGRDSCLLCQRERPEPAGLSKNVDSRKGTSFEIVGGPI